MLFTLIPAKKTYMYMHFIPCYMNEHYSDSLTSNNVKVLNGDCRASDDQQPPSSIPFFHLLYLFICSHQRTLVG